jgi:hypothetical protein
VGRDDLLYSCFYLAVKKNFGKSEIERGPGFGVSFAKMAVAAAIYCPTGKSVGLVGGKTVACDFAHSEGIAC